MPTFKDKGTILNQPRLRIDLSGSVFGFFDGAVTGLNCGAGFHINYDDDLTYKFHLSCGQGTNSKAELLGLWGILEVAICCGLGSFRIFGD